MDFRNKQKKKLTGHGKTTIVILLILLAFLAGIYSGEQKNTASPGEISIYNSCAKEPIVIHNQRYSSIRLPAVNRNGTGVAANLDVSIVPGSGLILLNLNRVLSKEETTNSIRMAALVASEITGIDLANLDIIYDIYANATVLEGPSAGAAMTIATIAALEDKQVNNKVMITGTINHDGTIGPAGRIKEKAISAKENGANAFYVPLGASKEINYSEQEFCYTWGTYEYCQPELRTSVVDLSEEAGIEIIEAEKVIDILDVFLKDKDISL